MSTAESVKAQLQELVDKANAKTGRSDTDLTTAVDALIDGYGAGTDTTCTHAETYEGNYASSEDSNDHSYEIICKACGAVVETGHWGEHIDEDGDGLCDLCGGCAHQMQTVYTDNGDGTHEKTVSCSKCGWIYSKVTADCADEDGNGVCDLCGASMEAECGHEDTSTGWTYHGDGTHTEKTICTACKAVLSEQTVACTDEDGDGVCDVCHGELETEGDGAVWSYAAGELIGLYQYLMQVDSNNVLVCTNTTAYGSHVAVGAVSGDTATLVSSKTIRTIPVPKAATKLTFTAGDTNTDGVKAVFIKGTQSSVTEYSGSPTDDAVPVSGKVCTITFNAGVWDYVVFNLTGSWSSSITAPQAGTKATLVFE